MQFPITYLEGNLIVNRSREAWALYRLSPWHYEHVGSTARLGLLWRLTRLFWELEEMQGQLLMIPRVLRPAEHLDQLGATAAGPLADVAREYCRQAGEQLAGGRPGIGYEWYLALRLPKSSLGDGTGNFFSSLWQEPRRAVDELLGFAPPHLLTHELEAYHQRERLLFDQLSRICRAERADANQAAWLMRRAFWRGIENELAEVNPPATGSTPLSALTGGEIDLRNPRRVAVTQLGSEGDVTGLTSFAYVSDLPDEMHFPGCEWLYALQDLGYPVEVCIRWSTLPHEEALVAVRRKRLEIMDQDEHNRRSGEDAPISLLQAQEQVAALEHDLKERRFPTLLASVGLAVSGHDPRQLADQIRQLRSHLSAFQVGIDVPAGDQLRAFVDYLPGAPQQVDDYVHRVPPEAMAASMFLASHTLGDHSGPYIGHTGMLRRPVYLDPTLPPRLNRSASMAFLGSLGGGKSFAANLLTYLAVVFSGAQALVLDPKGERSNWIDDLPELKDHLRVVTLGPGAGFTGRLDPFVLGRDLDADGRMETVNLAVSLLSFLGNITTGDPRFLALMSAVETVASLPNPAMTKVVAQLEAMGDKEPAVADLAAFYRALSRRAYANLIFGQGDEQGLELEHRLNVLQLQQLVMPPADKPRRDYSLEELLSVALMHAVTAFATQFTRRRRDTFKIVLLDEAWALLASSQGKTLVTHLLRTGRAFNNAVYLISQNVADLLDETVRNNLGGKFIFRSGDQAEVDRVLRMLNLEPEEENQNAVRQLETGRALFQDLEGRTGIITLDAVFPHLRKAFDTRPPAVRKEA